MFVGTVLLLRNLHVTESPPIEYQIMAWHGMAGREEHLPPRCCHVPAPPLDARRDVSSKHDISDKHHSIFK